MPSRRRSFWLLLPLLVLDFPAPAQIGYPGGYPPGGYPGGGYPYPGGGGGLGIPMPGRKKKKKDAKDTQAEQANLKQLEGMLRKLDDKNVVLEASDTRVLNIKRTEKTKFLNESGEAMKPGDLKPGDHLTVDVTQDDEGFFYAVNVNFEKKGTAKEQAAAAEPVEISTQAPSGKRDDDDRPILRRTSPDSQKQPEPEAPAQTASAPPQNRPPEPARPAAPQAPAAQAASPSRPEAPPVQSAGPPPTTTENASDVDPTPLDVDGRPHLQHGKPGKRMSTDPIMVADSRAPASGAPANGTAAPARNQEPPSVMVQSTRPQDPNIAKAADVAMNFTETLPNYVCQEFMARFISTTHVVDWRAQDVVSTEVVYEDRHENYRNIAINGKPTNKRIEELPGSWSTGEFGTVLIDIFSPNTSADFRFRKETSFEGKTALVYDYSVEHDGSHWRIMVASQTVQPAYKGAIWIDKRNSRVLRIEMETRNMPEEFPMDKVESAVDYDYVRMGGEQQFLLPVHAESLSCQRGSNICSRNTIDFRNYHKYSGESVITFGKPESK